MTSSRATAQLVVVSGIGGEPKYTQLFGQLSTSLAQAAHDRSKLADSSIIWLGDTSANGFKQSYGMMVNYRYKLGEVDANHEAYAAGRVVASREVRAQAKS